MKGSLRPGTWQQVVVVKHDNRPQRRTIEVTVTGCLDWVWPGSRRGKFQDLESRKHEGTKTRKKQSEKPFLVKA